MSYTYDQRKRPQGQPAAEPEQTSAPGPSAMAAGAMQASRNEPEAEKKKRSNRS